MGKAKSDCWQFFVGGKPGLVKQELWDGVGEQPKFIVPVYALRWLCFKSKLFKQLYPAKRLEYMKGMDKVSGRSALPLARLTDRAPAPP